MFAAVVSVIADRISFFIALERFRDLIGSFVKLKDGPVGLAIVDHLSAKSRKVRPTALHQYNLSFLGSLEPLYSTVNRLSKLRLGTRENSSAGDWRNC